jgi:hypothetical protein
MEAVSPNADPLAFRMLMERADNALQNRGMIMPGRGAAMANWRLFSAGLSEHFFESMKSAPVTGTLINEPPRKRLNREGVAQWEDPVAPLMSTEHLFMRGVCQIRHNIVHGNKADLNERDMKLIAGAHFVLDSAITETQLLA